MKARPAIHLGLFAAVALATSACGGDNKDDADNKKPPATSKPATSPAPATPPKAATATPPATKPDEPSKPMAAPAEAVQLPASALKPSVPKPKYGQVTKLVRDNKSEGVSVWGIAPIGGAKFVAGIMGRDKGAKAWWFKVAMLEKVDDKWTKKWDHLVEHAKDSHYDPEQKKRLHGAEVKVQDIDWDNQAEVVFRYRYPMSEGHEVRKLVVLNVSDTGAKTALAVQLWLKPLGEDRADSIRNYFYVKDLNGDKHPDVLLKVNKSSINPSPEGIKRHKSSGTIEYVWDPKTDTFDKGKENIKSWSGNGEEDDPSPLWK